MIVDFVQRWHEIEPLLDRLFDVPAAERSDWLHRHVHNAGLRGLVAQALDNAPGIDLLEKGVAQWLPTLANEPGDALPSVTGYRVLRFVGAGGMASVFEAERELPGGAQRVALKLLRLNVHDPDERRRFLREQRILARLQHPHIAQLLDAGFTPAGTPFLALEYIAGDTLVAYCERRDLGARDRLALFIDVCAAVENAHRNLIVHRDLKPGNVLVSADGCVKLVDFGIAKLLTGDGDETRTEARRATRTYAAPEQLAGSPATTAIDIYALGVLLAELLGGARPRRAPDCATGMAKPELLASPCPDVDDAVLRRGLGVDLHAIVREATRRDPLRRYPTVAALRDDIERHLQGRPLRARADTWAYRALTFIKRHRVAVAASVVGAVILAGTCAVSLYEALAAYRAAQDARAQTLVAEREARRADAVKAFLEGLFDSASPGIKSSETAEELLERGRERADRDFALQPALRVEVLALVGDLERRSGHADRAQQPLDTAAALANAQFGAADPRTLHVEYLIAKEGDQQGRVRDATLRLQRAVESFDAGPNRGSADEVRALAWLAGLDERLGDSGSAIDAGERALALARRALPDDSDALTEAILNLGWIFLDAGRIGRAEPLLREALLRKRNQLGERHADVADTMTILASALIHRGRYDESERLLRSALDIDATAYSRPHPHVAWHLNELGNVLALEGRLDEADTHYQRSMEIDRLLAPAADLGAAVSLANRARIRFRMGAYAQAEAEFREAIARKQRLLGSDYADNGRSYDSASLADVLIARGRLPEARLFADGALAEAQRRHHDAHPDVALALAAEARLALAQDDRARASAFAREAVATYAALDDVGSDKSIRASVLYAEVLQSMNRSDDAKSHLDRALESARAITPTPTDLIATILADLARSTQQSRPATAAARAGAPLNSPAGRNTTTAARIAAMPKATR